MNITIKILPFLILLLLACTPSGTIEPHENFKKEITISGKVMSIQNGKDGYTAEIKTKDQETFYALVSISNLGGMDNFKRLEVGERTTLKGEIWNTSDIFQIKISSIIEIETPTFELMILQHSIEGISPGDLISSHLDILEKGVLKNGEGSFEVFYIKNKKHGQVGYLLKDPFDRNLVGNIFITSEEAKTKEGIHIGTSYKDLLEKFKNVKVYGSEIEGKTYAQKGNLSFRLNTSNYKYEVDKDQIPMDTKIIEILVNR